MELGGVTVVLTRAPTLKIFRLRVAVATLAVTVVELLQIGIFVTHFLVVLEIRRFFVFRLGVLRYLFSVCSALVHAVINLLF